MKQRTTTLVLLGFGIALVVCFGFLFVTGFHSSEPTAQEVHLPELDMVHYALICIDVCEADHPEHKQVLGTHKAFNKCRERCICNILGYGCPKEDRDE